MAVSREKLIAGLESSQSVQQASEKLGMSTPNIWKRLKRYNLKVIRQLRVVERSK